MVNLASTLNEYSKIKRRLPRTWGGVAVGVSGRIFEDRVCRLPHLTDRGMPFHVLHRHYFGHSCVKGHLRPGQGGWESRGHPLAHVLKVVVVVVVGRRRGHPLAHVLQKVFCQKSNDGMSMCTSERGSKGDMALAEAHM